MFSGKFWFALYHNDIGKISQSEIFLRGVKIKSFEKLLPVVTFRGYFEDSLNKKFIINNPNFD